MTTVALHAERIRARRLELALSEREVASRWGVSTAVLRSVEARRVDADLTLGQVAKLADILGLGLDEVIGIPTAPITDDSLAADVELLGSVLADIRVLVPVEGIAAALSWDLDRVHRALDELDRRLEPIGLRVHRLGHDVRIARRVTVASEEQLRAVWRRHFAVRSLAPVQARLLLQIRDGKVKISGNKDTEKVRLPELANAGLIQPADASTGTNAKWELTDDVRFSVLLGEL
ncbi:helix-turn-helix transcriptional regulator [Janibacter sp. Y6]|uniref:helix-turn-helix domain-containing protein n=1 Tax=Janibacter sp. Y6 TaxID=2913552 RepID=UPI0034A34DD5